jgi:hypothetical protein
LIWWGREPLLDDPAIGKQLAKLSLAEQIDRLNVAHRLVDGPGGAAETRRRAHSIFARVVSGSHWKIGLR